MSETCDSSKIILEVKKSYDPYGILMPTYMKNQNNILRAQELISRLKWEKEGEEVKFLYKIIHNN